MGSSHCFIELNQRPTVTGVAALSLTTVTNLTRNVTELAKTLHDYGENMINEITTRFYGTEEGKTCARRMRLEENGG